MMSAAAVTASAFSTSQVARSQGLIARNAHQTAKTRLRTSRYLRCGMRKRETRSADGLQQPDQGHQLAERQEAHQRHRELRLDREQPGKCPERDHLALPAQQETHGLAA